MSFSLFARGETTKFSRSNAAVKFYPGHYVKLEGWQVVKTDGSLDTASIDTIIQELDQTFCLRGIKWVIDWGDIENVTTGAVNWHWTAIDNLYKRLWDMRQGANPKYKRLMLAINMRGSGVTNANAKRVIPGDLVVQDNSPGFTPKAGYTVYTHLWPYTNASNPDGYYAKLWETTIQNRFGTFCQELANHVVPNCDGKTMDQGDILCMMSSLESSTDSPYDGYQGGTQSTYEAGLFAIVQKMKQAFVKTPVTMSLNFTRAYVASIMPQLPALKIGINSPNSNLQNSINLVPTGGASQGVLLYYQDPAYINNIILNPEIQGIEYKTSIGQDAFPDKLNLYDFPSYESLYLRCKNDLNANYVVWQRNFPFWLGGTFSEKVTGVTPSPYFWPSPPNPMPSVLNTFLKTYPALNNINDPAGGLNTVIPTNFI